MNDWLNTTYTRYVREIAFWGVSKEYYFFFKAKYTSITIELGAAV